MTTSAQPSTIILRRVLCAPAMAAVLLVAPILILTLTVQAQTFTVLHTFTGGPDGGWPYAGVTIAEPGLLYGTTSVGGTGCGQYGCGVVFKMKQSAGGWVLSPLYEFTGNPNDGAYPLAGVVVGPNGLLYGTTYYGGRANYGTVFTLQPPPTVCANTLCYWHENILHSFSGYDGQYPVYGKLVFDQAENIYGTAAEGGTGSGGVVFEIASGTESVIHSFGTDAEQIGNGATPNSGVIFDSLGNLYGTTAVGGAQDCGESGCGVVFQLMPDSNGTWQENVLFGSFADSGYPMGTLMMDGSGNLYGTAYGFGTVFELTQANNWSFSVLYSISGCEAIAGVTMDTDGNLYGVCSTGGAYGEGMAFELTNSGGAWKLTDLHDFTGGSDGAVPTGTLVMDTSGNLYGTAIYGGGHSSVCDGGCGVVWEITP